MKGFELFISKYPPDHNLRKPTAEMLAQFQGKVPGRTSGFLAGIRVWKLRQRAPETDRSNGLY